MARTDRRGDWVKFSVWVWAMAAVLAGSAAAWGQLQPQQDPRQMMADQLRLLMEQALVGDSGRPTPDQLTQAQVLLNFALELAPEDAGLWRAQVEVASWRDDGARRREALGRLVALEPNNDAAQLTLILDNLARQQTLDQRLELVRRVLDAPASRSLSAPLRSRLASYAAAASRELGDADAFARRLAQAVELDPANADAAYMMVQLAQQQGDSPLHRGAALVGWAQAAPADPAARFQLGELLLREGAYQKAAQQLEMSIALSTAGPQPVQLRLWVTALAMSGAPDAALDVLRQIEAAANRRAAADASAPAGLAPELEVVRAAIRSVSSGDDADAAAPSDARFASLSALAESGDEAALRELAVARAVLSGELDTALQLAESDAIDPVTRDLVRGWVALRYGRTAEGRTLLKPLAQDQALAALGLALLEDDVDARASMLATIRQRDPVGVAGLLAVLNLRKLEKSTPPTPAAAALGELMGRTSARLWHTDLEFSPWLSMRLRVEPMRVGYLEPLRATAVLHNLSGAPINLTGTVPTRMLVTVEGRDGAGVARALPPMIVDIGRRLTLDDGERLSVTFRLDRGELGRWLAAHPAEPITLRAAAIVDPRTAPNGGVRPGAVGAMDLVRAIQAMNVPATSPHIDAWLADLDSPDAASRMRAIARLLRALADPQHADAAARRDEIGQAFADRWRDFSPLQQAWTMRFLPPADARPPGLARVVDLAQRSDDPLPRVVYLAAQVRQTDSPAMTAALRHRDPTIGEFARALRATLQSQSASDRP